MSNASIKAASKFAIFWVFIPDFMASKILYNQQIYCKHNQLWHAEEIKTNDMWCDEEYKGNSDENCESKNKN